MHGPADTWTPTCPPQLSPVGYCRKHNTGLVAHVGESSAHGAADFHRRILRRTGGENQDDFQRRFFHPIGSENDFHSKFDIEPMVVVIRRFEIKLAAKTISEVVRLDFSITFNFIVRYRQINLLVLNPLRPVKENSGKITFFLVETCSVPAKRERDLDIPGISHRCMHACMKTGSKFWFMHSMHNRDT